MESGPEFVKRYDPEGYKLVDDYIQGRLDVQPVMPRGRGGARGGRGGNTATRGDGATARGAITRGGGQ